jgi:cytochrome c peroxidase
MNAAFRPLLRWDGYASTLENFAKYPLSGVTEMDFHYLDKALPYVRSRPDYVARFQQTLQVSTVDFEHVERALATYQRTLISGNSPFDRYYFQGIRSALQADAIAGLKLFLGKADCVRCHTIERRYALFSDDRYHCLGVGFSARPGESRDIGLGAISTSEQSGLFLTPSLRNVAATAPYMHDGSIPTLKEVVRFFSRGGDLPPSPHNSLKPVNLTEDEQADLVSFLESLTGDEAYSAQGERRNGERSSSAPGGDPCNVDDELRRSSSHVLLD